MTIRANEGAVPVGRATRLSLALAIALAAPAAALDLALPEGATIVTATPPGSGTHSVATGAWDGTRVPTFEAAGTLRAAAWQIPDAPTLSIAAIAAGIEDQLVAQGYDIVLSCADTACGGFDFRHALDMGRSPDMHVDIGNFRYLAGRLAPGGATVAVTVSQAALTFYVHVVHVGDGTDDANWVTPSTRAPATGSIDNPAAPPGAPPADAIARLVEFGSAPLDDLRFRTGASELSGDGYASLVDLAAFLAENPERRVILVGHTDAEGGRESNIALSEARAEAVRRHLIDQLGANPAQLEAAGIGYLAPRATNETAGGREANRRVEVVLLESG